MAEFAPNTLYYGDNLNVLRDFPSECVDLIYLDPPFNSNRSYNVLFREAKGEESEAQIEAFGDTWEWTQTTQETYHSVVSRGDDLARLLESMVGALKHNAVTAYLTMMAPRLVELRRVLKPTGAIYLHCDPTASHYLKVLMDAIFDPRNFRNEIAWKRFSAKNDPKRFGRNHDVILFYSQSNDMSWNVQYGPFESDYVDENYRYVEEGTGRRYRLGDLTANKGGGDVDYEWHGARPYKGRHWAYSRENMDRMLEEGRIVFRSTGMPVYKRYLDEQPGVPLQDIWTDIRLHAGSKERLGYPTQKPEALLERIIQSSSNPGDIVLDPFCGCGTATVAAHRLGRQWIGIDITYLAVDLMRRRMLDTFPGDFPEGIHIDGEPADAAAALALAERDPFQFQFWSVARLGGVARGGENRKGRDRGVDGVATFPEFRDGIAATYRQVIMSVKGGHTGPAHVRELRGTVEREKAAIGVLVTIAEPTKEMLREAASAGVYEDPSDGKTYPRIQIITAEQIVHGKQVEMPSQRSSSDFARAPRARAARNQGRMDL